MIRRIFANIVSYSPFFITGTLELTCAEKKRVLTEIRHQCKIYTSLLLKTLSDLKVHLKKGFRKKGFFERIVTRNFKLRPKSWRQEWQKL